MRQYQPIWERLKEKKEVSIAAPVELHPRIIKAVKKEKYKDTGYKLLQSEANKTMKLYITSCDIKGIITFYLQDVSGIKVTDL